MTTATSTTGMVVADRATTNKVAAQSQVEATASEQNYQPTYLSVAGSLIAILFFLTSLFAGPILQARVGSSPIWREKH